MEVEWLAILQDMQFCIPLGISKLVVETDCLLAVRALEGAESVAVYKHLIVENLKLKTSFISCNFGYVSRLGNQVAHSLARHSWEVIITTVW